MSLLKNKAVKVLSSIVQKELTSLSENGTWKEENVITYKNGAKIKLQDSGKTLINFCANNYLNLSSHPEVNKATKNAIAKYGSGMSAARYLCGTQNIHKELEQKVSNFHNKEDSLIYTSGYMANVALFKVLFNEQDVILTDELNHASIIDGIRLSRCNKLIYNHLDMEDLERKLLQTQDYRQRVIATDGVFSMNGNIAPLDKICNLADKYNAIVFLDDCHATGVVGETGRGTDELFDVQDKVALLNSTFAKAIGGAIGGYTTGPKCVIDLLRCRSRPYLSSVSLPSTLVATASAAIDIVLNHPELVRENRLKASMFRQEMSKVGFNILGHNHPIVPVMIGDASVAHAMDSYFLERGIFVKAVTYPVVEKDSARFRFQISCAHSFEDLEQTVKVCKEAGKKFGII